MKHHINGEHYVSASADSDNHLQASPSDQLGYCFGPQWISIRWVAMELCADIREFRTTLKFFGEPLTFPAW